MSPDLAYQSSGDVDPDTANLTSQGLQRSLLMATYLKRTVMGNANVTGVYALQPMTHLQTAQGYPDLAPLGFIQQFALLNQITLPVDAAGSTFTANSFPINVAYGPGAVPDGVAVPAAYCPTCAGLQFDDTQGNNVTLVAGLIEAGVPGFHVFSAPWETVNALLAGVIQREGYDLTPPASYLGTNHVQVLSIAPTGAARLVTLDSKLSPPATFPAPPSPVASASCTHLQQAYFTTSRTGGVHGVVVPANINTNQRVYLVRHAEAHPSGPGSRFEDGNYVAAGQWRALALPGALRDTLGPNVVYSIDPAQWFAAGPHDFSYVRPSLTVLPYAIANNLPYHLVSSFQLTDPNQAQLASDFLFTGGRLSSQTVLLAWESSRIKPLINALLASYGGSDLPLLPPAWPTTDYDTIWTVRIDAGGDLTVDNALCEGIDSTTLPETAPPF